MRSLKLSALAATLVIALQPIQAAHCTTWTTSTTNDETIVIDYGLHLPILGRYLATDLCQDDPQQPNDPNDPYDDEGPCVFSIWMYAESNRIPGLQRGDEVVDDTCHGMIQSDSIMI